MNYTILPIISRDPVTFGAEYLALDGPEGEAWKKVIQSLHPKLLPQLKESALLDEEDSPYCVGGGVFDYQRGRELTFSGDEFVLSHCGAHFLDFLLSSEDCLQIVEEKAHSFEKSTSEEEQKRVSTLLDWWKRGYSVFVLQHI